MSVLPPEIHAALTQLLQALAAPDNAIRSHAEEQLGTEWVTARPDVLSMGLVEQMQAGDASVRSNGSTLIDLCHSTWLTFVRLELYKIDTVVCSSAIPTHSYKDKEVARQQ